MLVLKIALRNLLRQKRRNLLLGTVIAFGMCILVMAFAFSSGVSDILLNRIVVRMMGHINISSMERYDRRLDLIQNKSEIEGIIKEYTDETVEITESITAGRMQRVLGNGKAVNMMIVGIDPETYLKDSIVSEGDIEPFVTQEVEDGIVLMKETAEELNVKIDDYVRVRFSTVYGQSQTASFRLAATLEGGNLFTSMAGLVNRDYLKTLLDIAPDETQRLQIKMNDLKTPREAIEMADKIHKAINALAPPEGFAGSLGDTDVVISGYGDDFYKYLKYGKTAEELDRQKLNPEFMKEIKAEAEAFKDSFKDQTGIYLNKTLADSLELKEGDSINLAASSGDQELLQNLTVKGFFEAPGSDTLVLIHNYRYFDLRKSFEEADLPLTALKKNDTLSEYLSGKWFVLERSRNSEELMDKMRNLNSVKWKGRLYNVTTMYEGASQVLDIEAGINSVAVIVVIILFIVILIGVVNTLRMTIRERTREIGTTRAIGMQSGTVRATFVMEVALLALFACVVGVILAFILMNVIGSLTLDVGNDNIFSIFLVKSHLHFVPKVESIVTSFVVIFIIALLVAYFPSGRAAKLKVADALRHFE